MTLKIQFVASDAKTLMRSMIVAVQCVDILVMVKWDPQTAIKTVSCYYIRPLLCYESFMDG